MTIRIKPVIGWKIENGTCNDIEPALFQLLFAVQEYGSLKSSAGNIGLSYRHAWGIIKKWEAIFKQEILILERGRGKGARLTDFSEQLLWAHHHFNTQLQTALPDLTDEINETLSRYFQSEKQHATKLYASHGMAIHYLFELLKEETGFELDYETHGSLESLKYLNSGHCQLAGFHLPLERVHDSIAPQYQQWISPDRHLLLKVATREQGLIINKGNPKNITTLTDLTKPEIRYINRQRNSGTRTIFDQLLLEHNIKPGTINGYNNEEFTHVAVAAMIASGAADAGFGIEAAAARFDLSFAPFLKEAYVLAVNRDCDASIIKKIKNTLQSRKYRMKVNKLPGYNASNSGGEINFDKLLRKT